MPHVLVSSQLGSMNTKVFGMSQKEMDVIMPMLNPSGGRILPDGQAFHNQVAHVLDVLQFSLKYFIVSCTNYGDQNAMLWTLYRPFR